jgi:hypothetical protein
VKKPIAWLCLAAASLALSACGGAEPAENAKAEAPAKKKGKKGEKEAVNPWAKDGSQAAEPAKKAAKKKKGKGGDEAEASPWAKEPAPGSTPAEAPKAEPAKKKKGKKGEEEVSPWAKQTPQPAAT